MFINAPTDEAPSKIAMWVKGRASHHLRKEFPELKKLPALWTPTYFVATTGQVSTEVVKKYIENQRGKQKNTGLKPFESDFIPSLKGRGSHPPTCSLIDLKFAGDDFALYADTPEEAVNKGAKKLQKEIKETIEFMDLHLNIEKFIAMKEELIFLQKNLIAILEIEGF